MAVAFSFPEENNDVEVILRQISFLLNKLAMEIKKQQEENNQLRSARTKLRQSGEGSRSTRNSDANVRSLGEAIATCKQFSPTHAHVLHQRGRNTDNDPENQIKEQWDKNNVNFCQTIDQTDTSSITNDNFEEDDLTALVTPVRPPLQNIWWSWLSTPHISTNSICATAVLCVVGWHLLR